MTPVRVVRRQMVNARTAYATCELLDLVHEMCPVYLIFDSISRYSDML